jgi:chaperonin GroES
MIQSTAELFCRGHLKSLPAHPNSRKSGEKVAAPTRCALCQDIKSPINSKHKGELMKLRPLHDRVIVKRMEEEKMSAGGIVIPDSATEKPIKGEILAVGAGKILENGNVRALAVKAGDKVMFGKYSGTEVKVDGEELLVMREEDLIAIIEG